MNGKSKRISNQLKIIPVEQIKTEIIQNLICIAHPKTTKYANKIVESDQKQALQQTFL